MENDDARQQVLRELAKRLASAGAAGHLTAVEVQEAVFSLGPLTGHVATCAMCAERVSRERERNPLYPLFLKHPDSFWEGVAEAQSEES